MIKPARRKPGRPIKAASGEPADQQLNLRLTASQMAAFRDVGGKPWLERSLKWAQARRSAAVARVVAGE